jgi:molybdopterin synthase catalytic subunit
MSFSKPRAEDSFVITLAPLYLADISDQFEHPANGANVIMMGMVRNQTDGKPVVALEYQAYEPMALRVFYQIADDIRGLWPEVNRVAIHHRIGRLQIGEISVLIAIGSPHRQEAFEACQRAIEEVKHNAPIWKKEWFSDQDGKLSGNWVSIGTCERANC